AFALLALLLAAAAAVAAKALFGDDAPRSFPSQDSTLGSVRPGEARLLSVRRPDPDGGPPWGLRVSRTDRKQICLQIGRVVDGRLVAMGVAGAFGNDGRAHALPIEQLSCTSDVAGTLPARIGMAEPITRSGLIPSSRLGANIGCVGPVERRAIVLGPGSAREYIRRARARGDAAAVAEGTRQLASAERRLRSLPPACAKADLRTVIAGIAGSNVVSVTLTDNGVEQRVTTKRSEDGAYVFVVLGHRADPGTLTARFRDGLTCSLGGSYLRPSPPPSPACRRAFARQP
ncbi:MAG TPA: hypothetical protein VFB41_00855, partial [Solirubrobacteraceae bacterium]|nr:hypothetical protein [Solirubrobacteraceae bacterium]